MAKANLERQRRIYEHIIAVPGTTKSELAREIGVSYSALVGYLPSLERRGYLVSEDEYGQLWPFPGVSGPANCRL